MTIAKVNALARAVRADGRSSKPSDRITGMLRDMDSRRPTSTTVLRRYHSALLFVSAFGRRVESVRAAQRALRRIQRQVSHLTDRQRAMLAESGMIGSTTPFVFSYETLRTLSTHWPGQIAIDWNDIESTDGLDRLLETIILPAEQQMFDDGEISTQDWLALARGRNAGTDVDWLVREAVSAPCEPATTASLFEAAQASVVWDLKSSTGSTTLNRLSQHRMVRSRGQFRQPASVIDVIRQPMKELRPIPTRQADKVLTTTIAALASRGREVYAMGHANRDEVYLADIGEQTQIAVFGVRPEARLSLEGDYGYMLFARGIPVGYGGISPLFAQGNTGINIFEEYRGSEASMLFAQTLRVFAALFNTRHFIASPYQFGQDNDEAIQSGAFWFYYKMGFRPVTRPLAKLAADEWARLKRSRTRRTPTQTLHRLAGGDLVLSIPESKGNERFAESNLARVAAAVTKSVAGRSPAARPQFTEETAGQVRRLLGIKANHLRTPSARCSLARMAPIIHLIGKQVRHWPARERWALRTLVLSKCNLTERPYVRAMAAHERFRKALQSVVRSTR